MGATLEIKGTLSKIKQIKWFSHA